MSVDCGLIKEGYINRETRWKYEWEGLRFRWNSLFWKPERFRVWFKRRSLKFERAWNFGLHFLVWNSKKFRGTCLQWQANVWNSTEPLWNPNPKGFRIWFKPPLKLQRVSGLVGTLPFETRNGFAFNLKPPVWNSKRFRNLLLYFYKPGHECTELIVRSEYKKKWLQIVTNSDWRQMVTNGAK